LADRLERALRALLEKLVLDLAAADRRAAEVADVLHAFPGIDPDRGGVAIVAVAMDHYYSSVEASLEMIARVFDSAAPAGADWHRSLLGTMRLATETRPLVVDRESAEGLEDLTCIPPLPAPRLCRRPGMEPNAQSGSRAAGASPPGQDRHGGLPRLRYPLPRGGRERFVDESRAFRGGPSARYGTRGRALARPQSPVYAPGGARHGDTALTGNENGHL
jgi:hypothetical protein